ncbi:MAG: RNA ligase family protein [Clostridia bacterium]|nr:RNA ligase family protein [Clostridia bacterium]
MDCEYKIIKYPRTPHLEGSQLQPGDEDLSQVPFSEIAGRRLVIEEKIDGANSAVSFDPAGRLYLQSRGHFLTGGYREKHYQLFKQWAAVKRDQLYAVLGSRYVLYGEWMYAKHTVFYDALPHYFMAFDLLDRETGAFLDTESRLKLTDPIGVSSVRVLREGTFERLGQILPLLGDSAYITASHLDALRLAALRAGQDPERIARETDHSRTMEGLYIKVEENGRVVRRVKFVRPSFTQTVEASQSHWLERPIIPNRLCRPMDSLFRAAESSRNDQ